MRRSFLINTGILLFVILIISCEKDKDLESENENGFTLNDTFHPTTWAISANWEHEGEFGTELYLASSGYSLDESGEVVGEGDNISFELITPNAALMTGKYLFDTIDYDGDKPYTCNAWIFLHTEGIDGRHDFEMISGEVDISVSGNNVDIEYSMGLDNNLQLSGQYSGEIIKGN